MLLVTTPGEIDSYKQQLIWSLYRQKAMQCTFKQMSINAVHVCFI